jgi:hypothetical protein
VLSASRWLDATDVSGSYNLRKRYLHNPAFSFGLADFSSCTFLQLCQLRFIFSMVTAWSTILCGMTAWLLVTANLSSQGHNRKCLARHKTRKATIPLQGRGLLRALAGSMWLGLVCKPNMNTKDTVMNSVGL